MLKLAPGCVVSKLTAVRPEDVPAVCRMQSPRSSSRALGSTRISHRGELLLSDEASDEELASGKLPRSLSNATVVPVEMAVAAVRIMSLLWVFTLSMEKWTSWQMM